MDVHIMKFIMRLILEYIMQFLIRLITFEVKKLMINTVLIIILQESELSHIILDL